MFVLIKNKAKGSNMLGIEWEKYLELKKERPKLFLNNGNIKIVFDEKIVENYQIETGKKIGVLYDSEYNMLVVDLVYEIEGKYFSYERILPKVKKGAVVIVPKYKDKYILLKQYRHAIRDMQYSFPRGFGEEDLNSEENVVKEIYEELSARATNIKYLGSVIADSGLMGNKVSVYECVIDHYAQKEANEGIVDIVEVSYEKLIEMVKQEEIDDGFTLSAIAMVLCG